MQIALCHENVLPRRGGAEMYVADLARRLVLAGHDVHLCAARWDHTALPSALKVHALPISRGPRWSRPWQFSAALKIELAKSPPQVSIGFDKILGTDVYYPLGGLNAASAVHNRLRQRAGWRQWLARLIQQCDLAQRSFLKLERELILGPDRPVFIANSDFVRGHLRRFYGIETKSVPVIHNGIDPDRFKEDDRLAIRSTIRRDWNLASDDVVGAVVAMNYRLKGLEPLLRSVALLPQNSPFRLLIAGSPKTQPWKRLAASLGIGDRVRFFGHCNDTRRILFASDLLIHPTFYDPCSLVVLEALACGLPVITTKHNGASELVPTDAGTVVDDPHDLTALANTMIQWSNRDKRRIGGQAARAAAARWTIDHHVRAMEGVLASVCERRLKAAS